MTDDDLDRALFALPLATPPPGMRDHILAMTANATFANATFANATFANAARPARSLVFGRVEIALFGALIALATWVTISGGALALARAAGWSLANAGSLVARAGGETLLLEYFVAGAAVAAIAGIGPVRLGRTPTRS